MTRYKPPKDHPWRQAIRLTYVAFVARKKKAQICYWCGCEGKCASGCQTRLP